MTEGDPGFDALLRTIAGLADVGLEGYKSPCVKRRIAVRMRACGVDRYEAYGERLRQDPGEVARLKAVLTINVTTFFRNPTTWEHLTSAILPDLLVAADGHIRVWSAGCASGEEPYTIAMVIADLARRHGNRRWRDRVRIDATDIDAESLERAVQARYPRAAFREAPAAWVDRYTEPHGDGVVLMDAIRRMVHVGHRDLLRDAPPHAPYDLILCRNVMIYFDRPLQERLSSAFAQCLRPGGVLVLGKVEGVWGESQQRLVPIDVRERIFRRSA